MAIPVPATETLPKADETNTKTEATSTTKSYVGPRVTEGNAQLLAMIGKFPGIDSEALSVAIDRQDKPYAQHGIMPTVKGTDKKLRKLEALGVVGKYENPSTKRRIYSLTKDGIAAAWSFGYNMEHCGSLHKTSKNRANHYQMIAHVAAQFASPLGFFRESLGIEPVGIEGVISEHEMRGAYEPIKESLKKRSAKGESGDFGKWRIAAMQHAIKMIKAGRLDWVDVTESLPGLLTIGQPAIEEAQTKPVHQPDLAIIADHNRTGREAKNLLVEIELNKKSWEDYERILRTYKAELDHGFIYERAVYFTIGTQVETLLRKVDKAIGANLFESGRLVVLPLTHRDGTPVRFEKRITIGGN